MELFSLIFLLILGSFGDGSKVHELTDRFQEIRKDGIWLVQFYSPSCGHCKRLEPIWMHVAQALTRTNIKVGRIDVTQWPKLATDFKAYATPTIKFLRPDYEHTYSGERTKKAIVDYALRMAGPPVQEIKKAESVENLKKQNQLFFVYVGKRKGTLWEAYFNIANEMQPLVFFYAISPVLGKYVLDVSTEPTLLVHKDGQYYNFKGVNEVEVENLNSTLYRWINQERFETFPRISNENLKDVMKTGKFIVLAVVEENRARNIPSKMLKFRDKVETLSRQKRDVYHEHFQFGWMGNGELVNSILMDRIALPFLLVLNSSTFHHHVPEDDPYEMTAEEIETFLEQIRNETSPVYGGNGLHIKAARKIFDMKRNLEDMWRGNPLFLVVVFSLPTMFLTMIMWHCCCPDIIDADDDGHEHEGNPSNTTSHEKRE